MKDFYVDVVAKVHVTARLKIEAETQEEANAMATEVFENTFSGDSDASIDCTVEVREVRLEDE